MAKKRGMNTLTKDVSKKVKTVVTKVKDKVKSNLTNSMPVDT